MKKNNVTSDNSSYFLIENNINSTTVLIKQRHALFFYKMLFN